MEKTQVKRGFVLARIALAFGLLATAATEAVAATTAVSSLPVTFQVVNSNRSTVPCLSDGKAYTVRGHLVGPTAALLLGRSNSITTYVHGIGWGEFYWHFTAVPEYDYAAQMAKLGHVSLVYDQLGYGASDRAPGLLNCYGSEAQVASQIVDALRSGSYAVNGRPGPRFAKVALASNQAAAFVAEPAASGFQNVDALIVTSFSDFAGAFKPAFALQSAPYLSICLLGGEKANGTTGPRFYEYFPTSATNFAKVNFANATPDVVAAATSLRARSPCGEGASAFTTIGVDTLQRLLRQVKVPVLLVNGLEDAFFIQPLGGNAERGQFAGSNDVTAEFIANAGQALTLERTAPDFRQIMHNWLSARGF